MYFKPNWRLFQKNKPVQDDEVVWWSKRYGICHGVYSGGWLDFGNEIGCIFMNDRR